MRRRAIRVALALVVCAVSGCGTLMSTCGKDGLGVYSGVKEDASAIRSAFLVDRERAEGQDAKDVLGRIAFALLFGLDLPFSAALDTLLLPRTLQDRR